MIIPPLMPLIVSSKRWLKVITVALSCLCLCGFLLACLLLPRSWSDEGMTNAEWAAMGLSQDLLDAVREKDAVAVHSFLKKGGNANDAYSMAEGDRSLLMIAAEQGDLPTVKVLLHAGADVLHEEKGETALALAEKKYHAEVIECLTHAEYCKVLEMYVPDKSRPRGCFLSQLKFVDPKINSHAGHDLSNEIIWDDELAADAAEQ